MKHRLGVTALLIGALLGLVSLLAEPGYAQDPTPTPDPVACGTGAEATARAWSSDRAVATGATFVIPPGCIGTKVSIHFDTQFLPVEPGAGHTMRVGCVVAGPVGWGRGVLWGGGTDGATPPATLPAGSYTLGLDRHGKLDACTLHYTLAPGEPTPTPDPVACGTGAEATARAWSSDRAVATGATFVIPPGCIGTKVSIHFDTQFLPVEPGAGHTMRVGCVVAGPVGWGRGVLWGGGTDGATPPATLPAGSYTLGLDRHGKLDACTLHYTLAPGGGPGGTGDAGATVIPVGPGTTSDVLDLIFCIDLTSSMDDDIGNVKTAAANIVNTIAASSPDYRVAIIGYRDWNDDPMFEDFAFSSDKDTIVANINILTTFGGDDTPEAVLEALMRGIDSTAVGGWRPNVNKQIILMGDAPPHDPSQDGFTAASVAQAAFDADPVVIQSVVVGSDGYYDEDAVQSFKNLADLTGGKFFEAADASEVPAILERSITEGATGGGAAGGGAASDLLGGLTLLIVGLCCLLFVVLLAAVVLLLIIPKRRRQLAPVPVAPVVYPPQPAPPAYPQQPAPPFYPQQPAPPVVSPGQGDETVLPGSPQAMARGSLRVTQGIDAGQQFAVGQFARIGRGSDNDIVLRDTRVSRNHAAINFTGSGYSITDLGSGNGTTVNGTRIDQPCELRFGDTIGIGNEQLVFQQG